ncbi:MAG: carbamoyltransferase HypF [Methanobacteriaceae archaeon]|nr:carbamoyltransferase HypF [Methanobacteriaceae archaeon]
MLYNAQLFVEGIVQGVGFRPTVYRLAQDMKLNGYVRNMGNIVEIQLQATKEDIIKFRDELLENKPILSEINNIKIDIQDPVNNSNKYPDFKIIESSIKNEGNAIIPPDISICSKCLNQIHDKADHHYQYPFTSCTDCGPRFTIIENIPYDRKNTTMKEYDLCSKCEDEYTNPLDRRYHAEATSCNNCGPQVYLYKNGKIDVSNPIKKTAELLDDNKIFAIKGIGGTHLVCKTTDSDTIGRLRKKLGRKTQAFAVMTPDLKTAKQFVTYSFEEEKTITSISKPITILKKSKDYNLAPNLSPKLHTLGVMLPYTGLHYQLFEYTNEPAYVMTSANMPGNPMLIDNENIIKELNDIVDYFLLHDRKIVNRCDDSVIRYRANKKGFIRRSRGYVPQPYDFTKINNDLNVLTLGPELDVTFSILKGGKCYVSQHIGNTRKYKTLQYMKQAIENLMNLTCTKQLDYIGCDLHPEFTTTKLAYELSNKYNAPVIQVQHHHAHASSLLVEHDKEEIITITADGVGYGADGNIWGGEILYLNTKGEYKKLGGLINQPMAGGDLCTEYPIRMVMGILYGEISNDNIKELMVNEYLDYFKHGKQEIDLILKQLDKNFNITLTSSAGRILDAISILLKISKHREYEGECSMKLESVAAQSKNKNVTNININENSLNLDTTKIIMKTLKLIQDNVPTEDIAYQVQYWIAQGLADISIKSAKKLNIDTIGVTGGVFYNEMITETVKKIIEENNYNFIQHENMCPGDGSISLGQAAVIGWQKNNRS